MLVLWICLATALCITILANREFPALLPKMRDLEKKVEQVLLKAEARAEARRRPMTAKAGAPFLVLD